MRYIGAIATICLAALSACVTTPQPVPPTVDVDLDLFVIEDEIDHPEIWVTAGPGAIDPADVLLRVTTVDFSDATVDPSVELTPNEDGSFGVQLPGPPGFTHYLEIITEEDDFFLLAFTAGPGNTVVPAEAGADADGDGSPDAIDCAPEDGRYRGQRCP